MLIKQLRMVEIELFNFCNRACDWCPNKNLPERRTNWKYLDFDLLIKLLDELAENKYSGVFSFSRYNEPFADYDTLEGACIVLKNMFPNNKIVSNTNGDYLTKEILEKCLIDELTIMDYDCKGKDWCYEKLRSWNCENIKEHEKFLTASLGKLQILYCFNWPLANSIGDRGGVMREYSCPKLRDYPCYEPQFFIGINYDGTVSPCCNIRSDTNNKTLLYGSLKEKSLNQLLNNKENRNFRKQVTFGHFPASCLHCNNTGGRYTTKNGFTDL